jgi:hypothetical protein
MIIKLLIILFVLLIIYIKRNDIKRYLYKEVSNIKDLNDIDNETKTLIDYFSTFSSESLIDKMNNENSSEKEKKAIKKVLNDRQPPTTVF